MPPSDVSLKRSRKVPEMVFFSSRRSWLRLTKPMMRLKHRKLLRGSPASLLSSPCRGREHQVLPFIHIFILARSLHLTDAIDLVGLEEV